MKVILLISRLVYTTSSHNWYWALESKGKRIKDIVPTHQYASEFGAKKAGKTFARAHNFDIIEIRNYKS